LFLIASGTGSAEPADGISKLGYSIQVGAFSEVKNAERLTSRLQDQGIEAFYFKKENGLFAVRFGDFPSRRAAERVARKVVAEQEIESYFIAPPLKKSLPTPKEPVPAPRGKKAVARPARDDMGSIAARTAERFVGIPYLWGGCTVVDGMDCSGFVRAVYNLCGVNIPRTSSEQFKAGRGVEREDLVDGDLVFFGSSEQKISHVGIYVGNNRFVHAPKRGDDIKISSLDSGYAKKFVGARRYF
jgi:cell wall-associated NlpC family hydrolase